MTSFEVQSGRESVLEMLSVIFAKFPKVKQNIVVCVLSKYVLFSSDNSMQIGNILFHPTGQSSYQ